MTFMSGRNKKNKGRGSLPHSGNVMNKKIRLSQRQLDAIERLAKALGTVGQRGATLQPFVRWIADVADEDFEGLCELFGLVLDSDGKPIIIGDLMSAIEAE